MRQHLARMTDQRGQQPVFDGGQMNFLVADVSKDVVTQKISYESPDKTIKWDGAKIAFKGKVYGAGYDNERPAILFNFSDNVKAKDKNMLFYDYGENKVLWSAKTNATHFFSGNGAVVVEGYNKLNIHSCVDGSYVRKAEPGTNLVDGKTIVLNNEMIARIDLLGGNVLWRPKWITEGKSKMGETRTDYRPGNNIREEYRCGDWLYIVNDWVYSFDVEKGIAWNRKLSTSHKGNVEALAKSVAKSVVVSLLTAFAGYAVVYNVPPKLYHNQNSAPVFEGDRMYIAARNKLCCYGRTTGELLWESQLPRDYGGVSLSRAGDYLAVIGKGWKYISVNYPGYGITINKDEKPSILLADPKTGEKIGYLEFEEEAVVNDIIWIRDKVVILTPTRLYFLSDKLVITDVREATASEGNFLRFLRFNNDEMIIRTSKGLLALDSSSMNVIWSKELGNAPMADVDPKYGGWIEGARWVMEHNTERQRSYVSDSLVWLSTDGGRLMGIDLDARGKVVMDIELGTSDFSFESQGIIGRGNGYLLILPYKNLANIKK